MSVPVDGCIPSKLVQEDMEVGQVGGEVGQFNASQQDLHSQPASQPLDTSFDMESPYQGCLGSALSSHS